MGAGGRHHLGDATEGDPLGAPRAFAFSRAPPSLHQQAHQRGSGSLPGLFERAVTEGFELLQTHLVWGRVVPDIPTCCRELVAALAEGLRRTGA